MEVEAVCSGLVIRFDAGVSCVVVCLWFENLLRFHFFNETILWAGFKHVVLLCLSCVLGLDLEVAQLVMWSCLFVSAASLEQKATWGRDRQRGHV